MSQSRCAPLLALALVLTACAPKGSYQAMAQQPRYEAHEGSDRLRNGASSQALPPGVVPRGGLLGDVLIYTGLNVDGTPSEVLPFAVTLEILAQGQVQYNAFCTPCHDYAGTGQGIAVQRGYSQPPSFHTDELRAAPVGHIYGVITNGLGQMPSYAEQVPVLDRWAIVAYVRALQLSQQATLNEVPVDERDNLAPPEAAP